MTNHRCETVHTELEGSFGFIGLLCFCTFRYESQVVSKIWENYEKNIWEPIWGDVEESVKGKEEWVRVKLVICSFLFVVLVTCLFLVSILLYIWFIYYFNHPPSYSF